MSDTIVAISTKLGVGAISIVRVSGKDAISLVNKVFRGKDLTKVESHTINYGFINNGKEDIDEVLVTVMRSPKTFTREDVVEINCHGGIATTLSIFELLIEKGARKAEKGEFTILKKFVVHGGRPLVGEVTVSGAKNAAQLLLLPFAP